MSQREHPFDEAPEPSLCREAAAKVEAFLFARLQMRGIDPEEIITLSSEPGVFCTLTVADLHVLCAAARANALRVERLREVQRVKDQARGVLKP